MDSLEQGTMLDDIIIPRWKQSNTIGLQPQANICRMSRLVIPLGICWLSFVVTPTLYNSVLSIYSVDHPRGFGPVDGDLHP